METFFDLNEPIIQFTYALSFFMMGLAIALQSYRSSRLELARSLAWLAAFGLLYSFYEWSELFASVQEAYLTPRGIFYLHVFHLTLLSASLACLLAFGIALLRPFGHTRFWRWLPAVVIGLYLIFILLVLSRVALDPIEWHKSAEALARYLIGFPGGLLAAYSLREQTFRLIAPLKAPYIVSTLRVAGIGLALFALFGGLLPPPVLFFPGNLINTESFQRVVGIPPLVFQSIIGVVLAVTVIRAMGIFEVESERRIEVMEQQQILGVERERIARELHDGAIQSVYTAGLLVESAHKLVETDSVISGRLEGALKAIQTAIGDLRRSLTDLHRQPSGESLSSALQQISMDPRFRSLVEIQLDLDLPEGEFLSPIRTDHILAIVGEALSNIARHAHARQVILRARREQDSLCMEIQDDGSGFTEDVSQGYGLRNMRDRARLLGGSLRIESVKGKGTILSVQVPWREER